MQAEQAAHQAQRHALGDVSDLRRSRHTHTGNGGHRGSVNVLGEGAALMPAPMRATPDAR